MDGRVVPCPQLYPPSGSHPIPCWMEHGGFSVCAYAGWQLAAPGSPCLIPLSLVVQNTPPAHLGNGIKSSLSRECLCQLINGPGWHFARLYKPSVSLLLFAPTFWTCLDPTITKLVKLLLKPANSSWLYILKFKVSAVQAWKYNLSALMLMWQMLNSYNHMGW